jgi:transketolase
MTIATDPRDLLPPDCDTSTVDVLQVLHTSVLRLDGEDPDRFLLSKGHNPMAYYAVLAATGRLDPDLLASYGEWDSPLGHHPDRLLVPPVQISSGSLGHGLPIAVGLCLGLRARRSKARVVCLLGDAELDEGSNAEAVQYAGRMELTALTVVVVDNRSATHGWPGGVADRFAREGWRTTTVPGHDHDRLIGALTLPGDRPLAVVAVVETR